MTHIQQTLKKIDDVDLTTEDAIGKINEIISKELSKLPVFMTDFVIGEPLIRARYLTDAEDFHREIQDYSYNPHPEYIKLGRANFVGQQIFYASRFRITCLGEVRFIYANREKQEARYSVGRWEVQEKLQLASIVTPHLIRENNTSELFGLADFIEEKEKEAKSDPELSGFIDIYRYMALKYTEAICEGEEYKYKITAAFSNFIYNKLQIADGILYQSVQYPENFNVALKREAVDKGKIHLKVAAKQTYIQTGHLSYTESDSIQTENIDQQSGKIMW